MSGPLTSGSNFPDYLPKVSAGDRMTYDDINKMSKAIMRNNIGGAVGGVVKRTTTGSSVVNLRGTESHVPWTITCSGEYVTMVIAQSYVFTGQGDITKPASADFDYASNTTIPSTDFEIADDLNGCLPVMELEFPNIMYWNFSGGDKVVWLEVHEDFAKPYLHYCDVESYSKWATRCQATPIAWIDKNKNVLQINKGALFIDPTGLRFKKHPFQVTFGRFGTIGTNYKCTINTGSVISYPQAFVDIMSDSEDGYSVKFPFAIKRGESLGGGWHDSILETELEIDDFVYLLFERKDVIASDYDINGDGDGQWRCTINKGKIDDFPQSSYTGNYNTTMKGACADTMPACGAPSVQTLYIEVNILGNIVQIPIPVTTIKRHVKFGTSGKMVYPLAKLESADDGYPIVRQFIKSDFFFYPPLDARMSFTESTFGNVTALDPNSGGVTGLDPNRGVEPNP